MMITDTIVPPSRASLPHRPAWSVAAAILGVAWSAFGLKQWVETTFSTREHLIGSGLTSAQADLYAALPAWITIAFALGVAGGIMGCLLLLLRRRQAAPILAASLAGYVVLYIGDITEGVFAAFGAGQVVVLTLVVAIAAGLLGLARHGLRQGWLA